MMPDKNRSSNIFFPSNINELISTYKRLPKALLYAGGTGIQKNSTGKSLNLPKNIIYLSGVEEFSRINRTESYLEIGSTVTINRILSIGKHILPHILFTALKETGTYAVRNLATIGGVLCNKESRMNILSVLFLMDVRFELRKSGSSKWIPVSKFLKNGSTCIEEKNILTRIRIPFQDWNLQIYKALKGDFENKKNSLFFCALAKTQKGLLIDFRLSIGSSDSFIIRNKETEVELIGRKLPLSTRDSNIILESFEQAINIQKIQLTSFQKERSKSLLHWVLMQLTED